jgi:tripartite-type tricarboxylate transporter receptor subunit TctC
VQVSVWYGLFAPAQTPDDVIASLNREINKALAEPSVAATLTKQAINPAGGTPQRQADLLKSELEKWPRVVKAANISAD